MAKAIVLLSALCIVALANFAHCHPQVFDVEGKVYCDTCRVQFETKLSENVEGTKYCSGFPKLFFSKNSIF
ncbi:anther-specific protein lat52 [Nicotiana attenuata]|uniref:Anther-specific protein lat52 n=1 Tax=Nicotiana attenuata TaxID=49451 RepID=A0A1J6I3C0_NICAT|nr:anther-specific protein lat52 [Nicotiana attenuata]